MTGHSPSASTSLGKISSPRAAAALLLQALDDAAADRGVVDVGDQRLDLDALKYHRSRVFIWLSSAMCSR